MKKPHAESTMHRWLRYYKRGGTAEVIQRLCAYGIVPATLFEMRGLYLYRLLRLNKASPRGSTDEYDIRYGTPEDRGAVRRLCEKNELMDGEAAEALYSDFMQRQGATCFVAFCEGEAVGCAWRFKNHYRLTLDDYKHMNLDVRLDENEFFLGSGFADREHRRRGLFAMAVEFALDGLPDGAVLYSSTDQLNTLGTHAHLNLGFEIKASMTCTRVGNRRAFWRVQPKDGRSRFLARRDDRISFEKLLR